MQSTLRASLLACCAPAALFAQAQPVDARAPEVLPPDALRVELWNSGAKPGAGSALDLSSSTLGTGGLRARAKWLPAGRRAGPGRYESRGGVRIELRGGAVELACPNGARFTIDGRARIHADGRQLTSYLVEDLRLRFVDGCELVVTPGSEGAARSVAVVDGGAQHVLARRGRTQRGRVRAKRAFGRVWYLTGDADEIVSLASVGPMLLVRPVLVRGRSKRPRVLLVGDLLHEGARLIEADTPKRRVQYPNAAKIARLLVSTTGRLFARDKPSFAARRTMRGLPLQIAFGPQIRVDLTPHGRKGFGGLACGLRLSPEAERSLEFVAVAGRTTVHRVLPQVRQRFSRYLGAGSRFEASIEAALPWKLPLSSRAQRDKTLKALGPWLVRPEDLRADEASLKRR